MNVSTEQDGGWAKAFQAIFDAVQSGCSVTISKSVTNGTIFAVERDAVHAEATIPNTTMQELMVPGCAVAEEISDLAFQVVNYNPLCVPAVEENSKLREGDYVFACKYGDANPGDGWSVGYISVIDDRSVTVTDADKKVLGRSYFRHAMAISEEIGGYILAVYPSFEGAGVISDARKRSILGEPNA